MSVVVAYVPTPTGYLAVTEGLREARFRGTRLVVVNVVGGAGYSVPTAAQERDLDALDQRLAAEGIDHEVRQVGPDIERASEEILTVAEQTGAELLVVGLQRRSPVGKALLGSTAQRVLLGAHCPVLAVRAQPTD